MIVLLSTCWFSSAQRPCSGAWQFKKLQNGRDCRNFTLSVKFSSMNKQGTYMMLILWSYFWCLHAMMVRFWKCRFWQKIICCCFRPWFDFDISERCCWSWWRRGWRRSTLNWCSAGPSRSWRRCSPIGWSAFTFIIVITNQMSAAEKLKLKSWNQISPLLT